MSRDWRNRTGGLPSNLRPVGSVPRPPTDYPDRTVLAIFAGPGASARVVERDVRQYVVEADDGRTKDCGSDVRLACDTARLWAGLEGDTL